MAELAGSAADVQMPSSTTSRSASCWGAIAVIFITADQYALRAFDVHAVDYLLKPLARTLPGSDRPRARAAAGQGGGAIAADIADTSATQNQRRLAGVLIRDGANVHVLPVDKIDYVEAQDDYVAFKSEGKQYLKDQTLSAVEATLDPSRFVRIHRSFILNVDRISKVELYAKDSRMAILRDGTRLPVSRAGYARLSQLL